MHLFKMDLKMRFVAAEPLLILSRLVLEGVDVRNVEWIDYLTVTLHFPLSHASKVIDIFNRLGVQHQVIGKYGLIWSLLNLRRRPTLIIGMALYLLLAFIAPSRIFAVRIVGNELIPEEKIRMYAQLSGITFGAESVKIRSEEVKNNLIERLPELQWLGITTSGCVATIRVKERAVQETKCKLDSKAANVVAGKAGVVTSISAYSGNPLVSVGQSVQAGDILISGYLDCGRVTKVVQVNGEVFAYTNCNLEAVSIPPLNFSSNYSKKHTCYRLRTGKKLINLCNHSGIRDTTCVKMYSEDYWTLPGGFVLPVSIIKEEYFYRPVSDAVQPENAYSWLPEYVRNQLMMQMVAGEILDETLEWDIQDEVCHMSGKYACHEMIGRVKHEEFVEQYAEDN